jgi:sodium transport system permease protein
MRWSVVRLIAKREVRDQLRDRRTLFLILGLPVLMYPLFVGVGLMFAAAHKEKKFVVGVAGADHLPKQRPDLTPAIGGPGGALDAARAYPPFLNAQGQIEARYSGSDNPIDPPLRVVQVPLGTDEELKARLVAREADAIIVIEPGTAAQLEAGKRPAVRVLGRDGEENSKLAGDRVTTALNRWAGDVRATRFARAGLPPDFDRPVEVRDPQSEKSPERKVADGLRDLLVKVIPFLLVMWMLTGAIYPAIDMTAGEKERGTMETLLISPAERTEIVFGKFFAVATFAFGTGLWNVILMSIVVVLAQLLAPGGFSVVSLPGLVACTLGALPLALFLAALALALGVFARSTKEGNYYMVPLFFIVLPLGYLSMSPGIELNGMNRWIPISNALLVQQRLLSVRADAFPWEHIPVVVLVLAASVGAALYAAVYQFHRESVLFREAQTGGGKWSLFGKK